MGTVTSTLFTEYAHADTPEKGEADVRREMESLDKKLDTYKADLAVTQSQMISIKRRSERVPANSPQFREMAAQGRALIKSYRTTSVNIAMNSAMREQLRSHLEALTSRFDMQSSIAVIERTTPLLASETASHSQIKSVLTEATKHQAAIADNNADILKILREAATRAEASANLQETPAADAAGVFAEMDMLLSGPAEREFSLDDLRWPAMPAAAKPQAERWEAVDAGSGQMTRVRVGSATSTDDPGVPPPPPVVERSAAPASIDVENPLGL